MKLKSRMRALAATAVMAIASPVTAEDWASDGPSTIQIGFVGDVAMFIGLSQRPVDGKTIGMGVSIPALVQLVQRGDQLPFDVDRFDSLGTVAKTELARVASKDTPFDDIEGLVA